MANGTDTSNTIVTIGDINYLWGIFMLVASARKAGMREPFLVGTKDFTPQADRTLSQLGGVSFVRLDGAARSLTCLKPETMLHVRTEFATWADSDGFFTGDVSGILAPYPRDAIHFRLRRPEELPGAMWMRSCGCDGRTVPEQVLEAWRRDVSAAAGAPAAARPRFTTAGSACFFSLSIARHRRFLEIWRDLQENTLPKRDAGVVDKSLAFYPQLDESTLNACLMFAPDAPPVQDRFMMNQDRGRLFVHFVAHPKPWRGWTDKAFRFFDEYVSVLEWAADRGYELPGSVPFCLQRRNKRLLRLAIPFTTLGARLSRRLKRISGRHSG